MEHGQAKKLFPVIKNQTTYSSLIPLDQYLLWKETKETSWEDGKRKLVGLGWEGGRLGDGITELKTKYLGEGLPDKCAVGSGRPMRSLDFPSTARKQPIGRLHLLPRASRLVYNQMLENKPHLSRICH